MRALGRIFTAMITPFDERGAVDVGEAVRIAKYLCERGNDGVVVAGTTGEAPALETDEKLALWGEIKSALGPRAKVIAGSTGNNTRHSVELTREAERTGVDGILATVPYYNKPTHEGLLAHFGAIAEATSLPIVLYNVPSRTGTNMLPKTVHELARRYRNVVAVKESTGDAAQFSALVRDAPDGFTVWSGDDYFFLPALALGAYGLVSVAGHLCGRELRELADAFDRGDVAAAGRLHRDLSALFAALFTVSSPIPVKWAMNQLGFRAGACRPPLGPMPDELKGTLGPLIEAYKPLSAPA
jgi:4-hydroxy-tetrahydrodipicolinate synthase